MGNHGLILSSARRKILVARDLRAEPLLPWVIPILPMSICVLGVLPSMCIKLIITT